MVAKIWVIFYISFLVTWIPGGEFSFKEPMLKFSVICVVINENTRFSWVYLQIFGSCSSTKVNRSGWSYSEKISTKWFLNRVDIDLPSLHRKITVNFKENSYPGVSATFRKLQASEISVSERRYSWVLEQTVPTGHLQHRILWILWVLLTVLLFWLHAEP